MIQTFEYYGTHLPVLEALRPKPKRVLEFGGGLYSTGFFLGLNGLTRLVTVESNEAWRDRLREEYGTDKRWKLIDGQKTPALSGFDLILIDDGITPQERLLTIQNVLCQRHPKVVVHDLDYPPYLVAVESVAKVEVFQELRPWTGVVKES